MSRLLPLLLLLAGCASTPSPLQTSCAERGYAYNVIPQVGMNSAQVECATTFTTWESWSHTTIDTGRGPTRVYSSLGSYSIHVDPNGIVTSVFDY